MSELSSTGASPKSSSTPSKRKPKAADAGQAMSLFPVRRLTPLAPVDLKNQAGKRAKRSSFKRSGNGPFFVGKVHLYFLFMLLKV
jgi:hypothetical protein